MSCNNPVDYSRVTEYNNNATVFDPFDLDEINDNVIEHDIDPDLQFFQSMFRQNVNSYCDSPYYLENTFNDRYLSQNSNHSLSFLHFNIRSLPAHYQQMAAFLSNIQCKFDVIGLSETWLNDTNFDLKYFDGYNHYSNYRSQQHGGGVSLFVKDHIHVKSRSDLNVMSPNYESVIVELEGSVNGKSRNIIIGTIYRPPGGDVYCFIKELESLLENIKRENRKCYIMGDFNLDLLKADTHQPTSIFLDLLYANGYLPLINRPTRISTDTATLIDNIFTNNISVGNNINSIFCTDISDHLPIAHIYYHKPNDVVNDQYHSKRVINDSTLAKFKQAILNTDWTDLYTYQEVNTAYNNFIEKYCKCYNDNIPIKQNKPKRRQELPWLTPDLKQMIKTKNKMYTLSKLQPSANNVTKYKQLKNGLNHKLRQAEKHYYQSILNYNKNNIKETWKVLNSIIQRKRSNNCQTSFKLGDTVIDDPQIICETFNDYFSNIGITLANKIPTSDFQPTTFMESQTTAKSIYFDPTTQEEIEDIIHSLKTSSAGFDDIDPIPFKHVAFNITPQITYIINASLISGKVPDNIKKAKIIPIYKGGDSQHYSNSERSWSVL